MEKRSGFTLDGKLLSRTDDREHELLRAQLRTRDGCAVCAAARPARMTLTDEQKAFLRDLALAVRNYSRAPGAMLDIFAYLIEQHDKKVIAEWVRSTSASPEKK